MTRENVLKQIIDYVTNEILDGAAGEVEENTPLLEWGVLNSLEVVRLTKFLRDSFEVDLALDQLTPRNLRSPGTIADLVVGG